VFDCDVWPNAGVAMATSAAESSHADLRMFLSPARDEQCSEADANPDRGAKEASAAAAQQQCRRAAANWQQRCQ
jgi:hypothetical protein